MKFQQVLEKDLLEELNIIKMIKTKEMKEIEKKLEKVEKKIKIIDEKLKEIGEIL